MDKCTERTMVLQANGKRYSQYFEEPLYLGWAWVSPTLVGFIIMWHTSFCIFLTLQIKCNSRRPHAECK